MEYTSGAVITAVAQTVGIPPEPARSTVHFLKKGYRNPRVISIHFTKKYGKIDRFSVLFANL